MNNRRVDGRHPWCLAYVPFRSWRSVEWRLLLLLTLLMPGGGAAAEDEQPSVDLLEFLGSWETKDGDEIDPVSLLGALLDDTKVQPQQTQSEGKQND